MPDTRPESYQVDHGRDSAACVVSRRHAAASHENCSAGKLREAGFTNDAAVQLRDTGMQRHCTDTKNTCCAADIVARCATCMFRRLISGHFSSVINTSLHVNDSIAREQCSIADRQLHYCTQHVVICQGQCTRCQSGVVLHVIEGGLLDGGQTQSCVCVAGKQTSSAGAWKTCWRRWHTRDHNILT